MRATCGFVITKKICSLSLNSFWIIWDNLFKVKFDLSTSISIKKGSPEFWTFITSIVITRLNRLIFTKEFLKRLFVILSLSFHERTDTLTQFIIQFFMIYFCLFLFLLFKIKNTTWFTTFLFTWCWMKVPKIIYWSEWNSKFPLPYLNQKQPNFYHQNYQALHSPHQLIQKN